MLDPGWADEWVVAGQQLLSELKVRAWIKQGELRAINTATALCARVRFVVPLEALVEFERCRTVAPLQPPPRRRRQQRDVIDYYPDT
jgi:hypothetical protein